MITFTVSGTPAGQGVHRVRPGAVPMIYDATKTLPAWRKLVVAAARDAHEGEPLDGPLSVTAVFRMPYLKSHFTASGAVKTSAPSYKTTAPDLDHLLRAIGDALKIAGVIVDDARIVHWDGTKTYGLKPGATVMIRELA